MILNFKEPLVILMCLISAGTTFGQQSVMISSGEIVYEKRINAYGILRDNLSNQQDSKLQLFADQYKAGNPQFHKTLFNLFFTDSISLFQPDHSGYAGNGGDFLEVIAANNTILNDLKTNKSTAQKNISGNEYIIRSPIRKIKWRYTNNTREILGFHCHRANALIMDSVYVVAFYTDQITSKSGPESFIGLPGMILQIALPQEYIVWEAKKVIAKEIGKERFAVKFNGTPATSDTFVEATKQFLQNNIGTVIKWFVLMAQL